MPVRRAIRPLARPRLLAAAAVLAGATALPMLASQSAGAAPTSSQGQTLAGQAASLDEALVSTSAQLHDLAVRTAAASAAVARADRLLAVDRAALARMAGRLAATRAALRAEALAQYMGHSSSSSTVALLSSGTSTQAEARQEYVSLSNGGMATAIDSYRSARAALARRQAHLHDQVLADQNAFASLVRQRQSLNQAVHHEQQLLAQVQARQAALAAQEAQAAAARQAAMAAAQAAQAARAARAARAAQAAQGAPLAVSVATLGGSSSSASFAEDLARLRQCESGDDYQANTGNGYYGAYQFALSTWESLGFSGLPSAAPPATQTQAATELQHEAGWGQWPVCAALLGLD